MSGRTELVAALNGALPGWPVLGHAADLDAVSRPTLMVWQESMRRPERFGLAHVEVSLRVWVLVGNENPARVDDALDKALEDVLFALQPLTWVAWSEATRGVWAERLHGYEITATAVAAITTDEGA